MTMVLWTVLSGDYSDDSRSRIMKTVEPFIRPGSIVVFHDTAREGQKSLPGIIKEISTLADQRNVRLGGIDELTVCADIKIGETNDN